jgi:excinuclease ABC subunit B
MGRDVVQPGKSLFRKNDLDEMTVSRTEKPIIGKAPPKPPADPIKAGPVNAVDPLPLVGRVGEGNSHDEQTRPIIRAKPGVGSYEDAVDEKQRKKRTKGKTGRPGK